MDGTPAPASHTQATSRISRSAGYSLPPVPAREMSTIRNEWSYEQEWRMRAKEGPRDMLGELEMMEVLFEVRYPDIVRFFVMKSLSNRDKLVTFYEMTEERETFKLRKKSLSISDKRFEQLSRGGQTATVASGHTSPSASQTAAQEVVLQPLPAESSSRCLCAKVALSSSRLELTAWWLLADMNGGHHGTRGNRQPRLRPKTKCRP